MSSFREQRLLYLCNFDFDFEMSVTGVFRKCLERQVFEGVRIQKCEDEGGSLLNSKKEYFTSKHIQTMFKQW